MLHNVDFAARFIRTDLGGADDEGRSLARSRDLPDEMSVAGRFHSIQWNYGVGPNAPPRIIKRQTKL
jgi:hypothetical protein